MFDNNPFRDFKEMMKKKRLSENTREFAPGGGGTTRQQDSPISGPIVHSKPREMGSSDWEKSPDGAGEDPLKSLHDHHKKMMAIVNNPDSSAEELSEVSQGLDHEVYFKFKEKKEEVQNALRAHTNYNPELHSRPVSLVQFPQDIINRQARSSEQVRELVARLNQLGGR